MNTLKLPDQSSLPQFQLKTYEEHVASFQELEESLEAHLWAQASICSSLNIKWGEGSINNFAQQVGKHPERIRQLIRTFNYWQDKDRPQALSFSHLQSLAYAAKKGDLTAEAMELLIQDAEGENLSVRALERTIQAIGGSVPPSFTPEPEEEPEEPEDNSRDFSKAAQLSRSSTVEIVQTRLMAYYSFMGKQKCWVTQESKAKLHHLKIIPSSKGGMLKARQGLAIYAVIPLVERKHSAQGDSDSVHNMGEEKFIIKHFESLEKFQAKYIRNLLEFINQVPL